MSRRARVTAGLALAVCAATGAAARQPPAAGVPTTFEASWSATGERHTLPVEDGATAATVRLSGALVLTTGEGLARGFRAEALGFDDGRGTSAGRAVWTDDCGDRVFSTLAGHAGDSGRRIVGTITGGTGRYAGVTGTYAFTWDYVMDGDEGRIHASTARLTGSYRREAAR